MAESEAQTDIELLEVLLHEQLLETEEQREREREERAALLESAESIEREREEMRQEVSAAVSKHESLQKEVKSLQHAARHQAEKTRVLEDELQSARRQCQQLSVKVEQERRKHIVAEQQLQLQKEITEEKKVQMEELAQQLWESQRSLRDATAEAKETKAARREAVEKRAREQADKDKEDKEREAKEEEERAREKEEKKEAARKEKIAAANNARKMIGWQTGRSHSGGAGEAEIEGLSKANGSRLAGRMRERMERREREELEERCAALEEIVERCSRELIGKDTELDGHLASQARAAAKLTAKVLLARDQLLGHTLVTLKEMQETGRFPPASVARAMAMPGKQGASAVELYSGWHLGAGADLKEPLTDKQFSAVQHAILTLLSSIAQLRRKPALTSASTSAASSLWW